jgi:selenocysteine lyase/cysteine desulfurase
LPVPWTDDDDIVNQFEAHLTPRTRLIMICHLIDLTGQVLPVKRIAALAHAHGIPLMVDGAQGFGQLHFTQADLDCDFYATSLHKWLMGPHGTGMLFIRKDRISSIWPLMPADVSLADDIRKFEDTGTQSPAGLLALSDALVFHQSIGAARKEARLRFLRDYWLRELDGFDRLSVLTNCEPACSAGMATVSVEGIDSRALRDYLWGQHRITVRAIDHPNVKGIRISPGIYTTLEELDYFVGVMHGVLKSGLS